MDERLKTLIAWIKKSTRRFIEVKRPVDRVAVVTFSDTQTIVSDLESDKEKLLARIKDLDGGGGSLVWDSIKFAQNMLEKGSSEGRRRAIVVMTDGLDNSLTFEVRSGSKISFATRRSSRPSASWRAAWLTISTTCPR